MRSFIAATAAIATLLASTMTAAAQAPPTAKPEEILKEVVAGMPRGERQEVRVFTATLKPGDRTPFHTHRFPVAAYVLEGAFTLELEGRPPVIVKAGEAILEPPNVRMTGFNRAAENTRIVIFYVAEPGTPFLEWRTTEELSHDRPAFGRATTRPRWRELPSAARRTTGSR